MLKVGDFSIDPLDHREVGVFRQKHFLLFHPGLNVGSLSQETPYAETRCFSETSGAVLSPSWAVCFSFCQMPNGVSAAATHHCGLRRHPGPAACSQTPGRSTRAGARTHVHSPAQLCSSGESPRDLGGSRRQNTRGRHLTSSLSFVFCFWPGLWDLVPQPGTEPRPPALGVCSLNRTTSEAHEPAS